MLREASVKAVRHRFALFRVAVYSKNNSNLAGLLRGCRRNELVVLIVLFYFINEPPVIPIRDQKNNRHTYETPIPGPVNVLNQIRIFFQQYFQYSNNRRKADCIYDFYEH